MENREEFKSAKSKVLKYLSYRDRSFLEVHTYLNRKGFSKSAISKTLDYFTEHDYINDERFALYWGQSRVTAKKIGKSRLRLELMAKGIEVGLIEKTLGILYDEIDEWEMAESCAKKKLASLKGTHPEKIRNRLAQFLKRKGFPGETIYKTLDAVAPQPTTRNIKN